MDRNKNGQFVKGHKVKLSQESRKRIGEKNSILLKGRKLSEETKRKISETNKKLGRKPPIPWGNKNRLGKKLSDKTKQKISQALRGKYTKEKSSNWQGGKAQRKHNGESEYLEWRTKIFKRDSFTCVICEMVGGKLNAHHIKEWAKYPKLRYDLDNGITLCEDCHCLIHKQNGR